MCPLRALHWRGGGDGEKPAGDGQGGDSGTEGKGVETQACPQGATTASLALWSPGRRRPLSATRPGGQIVSEIRPLLLW